MTEKDKLERQIIHFKNEVGRADWFISRGYNPEENQERKRRAKREIQKRERKLKELERAKP